MAMAHILRQYYNFYEYAPTCMFGYEDTKKKFYFIHVLFWVDLDIHCTYADIYMHENIRIVISSHNGNGSYSLTISQCLWICIYMWVYKPFVSMFAS